MRNNNRGPRASNHEIRPQIRVFLNFLASCTPVQMSETVKNGGKVQDASDKSAYIKKKTERLRDRHYVIASALYDVTVRTRLMSAGTLSGLDGRTIIFRLKPEFIVGERDKNRNIASPENENVLTPF